MNQNIVITGEGILCAIGLDKSEVLSSLREKRSGIGTMKYLKSSHRELPVGEVPLSNDDMRSLLKDGTLQSQLGLDDAALVNRTTLMGILAVRQALEDAQVDGYLMKEKPMRLVLISGTTVAGMDVTENLFHQLQQSGC